MLNLATASPDELSEYLSTQPWWSGGRTVAHVDSAGAGNMNRVRRLTFADNSSVVLKQATHAVERFPQIAAPIERIESERRFYERVTASPIVSGRMPSIVGSDPSNHLIALADLGNAHDASRWYDGQSARVIARALPGLLEWLTHLHQLPTEPALGNHAMRALNHEHIFELPFASDNTLELGELAQTQFDIAADTELTRNVSELGEVYTGSRTAGSSALLHGDFYPGSWLLEDSGEQSWVIDPEFTFTGPAEFDLGVCLAHLLMCGLPLIEASSLLDAYEPGVGFSMPLSRQFAGIEVLRRLLGVARLPLVMSMQGQVELAKRARQLVTQPTT